MQKGETLYKISRETGVSVPELVKYNKLGNTNIKAGMVLNIPIPTKPTEAILNKPVKDTVAKTSAKPKEVAGSVQPPTKSDAIKTVAKPLPNSPKDSIPKAPPKPKDATASMQPPTKSVPEKSVAAPLPKPLKDSVAKVPPKPKETVNAVPSQTTSGPVVTAGKPIQTANQSLPSATNGAIGNMPKEHIVKKGESLYFIARKYNVPMDSLRAWNAITGKDNIVKLDQSIKLENPKPSKSTGPLPSNTAKSAIQTVTTLSPKEKAVFVDSATVKPKRGTDSIKTVAKALLPHTDVPKPLDSAKKNLVKDTLKKVSAIAIKKTVNLLDSFRTDSLKKASVPIKKTDAAKLKDTGKIGKEIKKLKPIDSTEIFVFKDSASHDKEKDTLLDLTQTGMATEKKTEANAAKTVANKGKSLFDLGGSGTARSKWVQEEGFFANEFNRGEPPATVVIGDAAIVKSSFGWEDKKYYVLVNEVDKGTIVHIKANNKTISAKVIGPLPAIKEDTGLILRINSAAAAALGVEGIFQVTLEY